MKNDLSVFMRIRAGDWDAFGELFEKYSQQLYTYAYAFLGDRETAEDIIQDMFVYLWSRREKIECHEATYGYLLRSVRSACINHGLHRRVAKRHEQHLRDVADYLYAMDDREREQEIGDELRARMEVQMEGLPERCREVFVMGTLDGLSYADIAEKLGISVNTVKTQMQRARGKFRKK